MPCFFLLFLNVVMFLRETQTQIKTLLDLQTIKGVLLAIWYVHCLRSQSFHKKILWDKVLR